MDRKEFEIVRDECPVCGDPSILYYREKKWAECTSCHLVYLQKFLRLEGMTVLLNDDSDPYFTDNKIDGFDLEFNKKRSAFVRRIDKMLRHAKGGESVCEVGFGGGSMLKLLFQKGYRNLSGIEIIQRYVDHVKMKMPNIAAFWGDVSITQGDERDTFPSELANSVGIVLGSEMLEHVERPVDFLKGAKRLLKSGGMAVFSFAVADGRDRLSSSEWQYWGKPSIKKAAELAGWDVFDIRKPEADTVGFVWLIPKVF